MKIYQELTCPKCEVAGKLNGYGWDTRHKHRRMFCRACHKVSSELQLNTKEIVEALENTRQVQEESEKQNNFLKLLDTSPSIAFQQFTKPIDTNNETWEFVADCMARFFGGSRIPQMWKEVM